MEFKDYYTTMGVSKDATQDEIKRAYRKLARKYHPDVSKEAEAETCFKEINEAYEVLKDPEKRAAYDQLGKNWKAGQEFRPPPGWDAGFEFSGGGFTGADAAHFSDFFESLFGAGSPFGRHAADAGARGAGALEGAATARGVACRRGAVNFFTAFRVCWSPDTITVPEVAHMSTLHELQEGIGRAWDSVAEGWNHLTSRAARSCRIEITKG